MTDCEKLSPNALEIFRKMEPFFPPDPWKSPQWKIEGLVNSNGQLDLRKSADRIKMEEQGKNFIGQLVQGEAERYRKENGSLLGFGIKPFTPFVRRTVELLLLLSDLDFQIETMDLVVE